MVRHVIISILLIVSLTGYSQNFMFNQHGGYLGKSYLVLTAIDTTATTGSLERTMAASSNQAYIIYNVNYIEFGNTFINPDDYTYTKSMNAYAVLRSTYFQFMNYAPYRSIWASETLQDERRIEITKNLYFSSVKTIHVGIFADNFFDLYVNGDTLAITNRQYDPDNAFLVDFHLFEVETVIGKNTFTFMAENNGSDNALGFVILDNTKDELFDNPIPKSSWNVLSCSEDYIGETINSVICPSGYNYDNYYDWCFKDIDLADITTDDYMYLTPIIDEDMIYDYDYTRLDYGDRDKNNLIYEYKIDSIFIHQYNNSGLHIIRYNIIQNGISFTVEEGINVN